jgi:DNA adenine methylase
MNSEFLFDLFCDDLTEGLRPAFGSPGGKRLLSSKIIPYFPEHKVYVEPFIGGAAVFFKKKPSEQEIINDKDSEIAFAYKFLKGLNENKIKKLESFDWHCNEKNFDRIKELKPKNDEERFYKHLLLNVWSYGKMKDSFARDDRRGDNYQETLLSRLSKLTERLKNVKIYNKDWKDIVEEYDGKNTFFYFDPPYYTQKGSLPTDLKPEEINNYIKKIKGKFLLSYAGNNNERKYFSDLSCKNLKVLRTMNQGSGKLHEDNELLLSNFGFSKNNNWLAESVLQEFNPERYQPEELQKLNDLELIQRHAEIVRIWKERGAEANDEMAINSHAFVADELKRRGLEHRYNEDIDKLSTADFHVKSVDGKYTLEDALKFFNTDFYLKDPFLALTGGTVVSGEGHDWDIWVNWNNPQVAEHHCPYCERFLQQLRFRLQSQLPEELQSLIHLVPETEGKFTNYTPLARMKIEFMKPEERTLMRMSMQEQEDIIWITKGGQRIPLKVSGLIQKTGGIKGFQTLAPIQQRELAISLSTLPEKSIKGVKMEIKGHSEMASQVISGKKYVAAGTYEYKKDKISIDRGIALSDMRGVVAHEVGHRVMNRMSSKKSGDYLLDVWPEEQVTKYGNKNGGEGFAEAYKFWHGGKRRILKSKYPKTYSFFKTLKESLESIIENKENDEYTVFLNKDYDIVPQADAIYAVHTIIENGIVTFEEWGVLEGAKVEESSTITEEDFENISEQARAASEEVNAEAELFLKEEEFIEIQNHEDGILNIQEQKRPLEEYPKNYAVFTNHFRGRSVHLDFRRRQNGFLHGETLMNEPEGLITEPVDTIEKGKKWNDILLEKGKFRPDMNPNEKVVMVEKAEQPLEWMNAREVKIEPGQVGATKENYGVLITFDEGMAYLGVQKPYFKEFFLDMKHFKGRMVERVIGVGEEWEQPPAGQTVQWQTWTNMVEQTPYLLTSRGREKHEDVPPEGVSWLPPEWEQKIPSDMRWWKPGLSNEQKLALMDKSYNLLIANGELKDKPLKEEEVIIQEKKSKFILRWHWWKGQEVIRNMPATASHWDLVIDTGKDYLDEWNIWQDPLRTEKATADRKVVNLKSPMGDSVHGWLDFSGSIPAIDSKIKPVTIEKEISQGIYSVKLENGDIVETKETYAKFSPGQTAYLDQRNNLFTGKLGGSAFGNPNKIISAYMEIIDSGNVEWLEDNANFSSFKFDGKILNGYYIMKKESPQSTIWVFSKSELPGQPVKEEISIAENRTIKVSNITKPVDVDFNGRIYEIIPTSSGKLRLDLKNKEISKDPLDKI